MAVDSFIPDEFTHTYDFPDIIYGPGRVSDLGDVLNNDDRHRAMVVCGKTVGSTSELMDPVRDALGSRLVHVFDETTPEKRISTALSGAEIMNEADIDALVALGGGSSVDIARAMTVLAAEDVAIENLFSRTDEYGNIVFPDLDAPKTPVYAVPTTLSGAELTCAAGANFDDELDDQKSQQTREGPIYDRDIIPNTVFYDPKLISTTPTEILAASGMNGFDHGIEALYSRHGNPATDAVAMHGLRLLKDAFPAAIVDQRDLDAVGTTAVGVALASFGLIDPESDANKYSIIHAFAHIISRHYTIQQGSVHGIVAPHVLRHLFEHTAGQQSKFVHAFDLDTNALNGDELTEAIVDEVVAIRDEIGLPSELRSVSGIEEDDLPQIAEDILQDVGIQNGPRDFDPDPADIEQILRRAW
jgi:alcohol dehydrogenase class IV